MGKRLFLLIICSLLGMINAPSILTASDTAPVAGLSNVGVVETIPLPEPEPEPVIATVAAPRSQTTYVAPATQSVEVAPANSISVAGRVIPIVDVADTAVDAGDHVNKYGTKFLYGHNTSAVFGNLPSVGVGNVFTVAYGGTTRNYQVQEVQIYEKTSPTQLSVDGRDYRMSFIANGKGRYDMVLMTCYGTMLGGGDATHRYVVFANVV